MARGTYVTKTMPKLTLEVVNEPVLGIRYTHNGITLWLTDILAWLYRCYLLCDKWDGTHIAEDEIWKLLPTTIKNGSNHHEEAVQPL